MEVITTHLHCLLFAVCCWLLWALGDFRKKTNKQTNEWTNKQANRSLGTSEQASERPTNEQPTKQQTAVIVIDLMMINTCDVAIITSSGDL